MRIIDKAVWQMDGGVPEDLVVKHFKTIFSWLDSHAMLTLAGKEELDDGIDDTASLNEDLITPEALDFLEKNYDKYLKILVGGKYGNDLNAAELERIYLTYLDKM